MNQRNIELWWSTFTEHNNDYFTVEKTLNGMDYSEVGSVNGSGTSFLINNYSLTDYQLKDGMITYYRLKQTDYDGKYSYSNLISVDNIGSESIEVILITNSLGQEVNDQYRGLIIIFFSDGTSSKIIR